MAVTRGGLLAYVFGVGLVGRNGDPRRVDPRVGGEVPGKADVGVGDAARRLAHVDHRSSARVGRYGVHLEDLERIAVPAIQRAAEAGRIVVIDEIGKMELFSRAFRDAVLHALDSDARVLATIHRRRDPFSDGIRDRADVAVHEVTRENRDRLVEEIRERLMEPAER